MRQKSVPVREPATQVLKNIRRATRRHFSAEDKIRIVLEGLRGEESIAELCRRATPALRLFHAGYIDRPRAQLDYYPTAGSSPIAYALADRGARLLIQRDGIEFANVEWSRKNRKAGRPFIEHQLEIVDFSVALQRATGARRDVQFIHPNDIIAAFPEQTRAARNPLSLRVKLSHQGAVHKIGLVPDLVFGLQFADGSRHSFIVEIDRGTMPIARSDFLQTSFERKMRAYLTAHAGKQHEKHFGWKTFRVLTGRSADPRRLGPRPALGQPAARPDGDR